MSNPSVWQPLGSATDGVPTLAFLSGVEIPVPEDGITVFVVDTGGGPGSGADYRLSLTSGAAIDGFNVVSTFLGGASRWLRLSVTGGISVKAAVLVISTTPIILAGPQVVDGVGTAPFDRVLVAGQGGTVTVPSIANGYYNVNAGAWTRTSDMAAGSLAAEDFTFVEEGTVNADTGWVCVSNPGSDVVGTNALQFTQFSSAGVILAGLGLNKIGNVLNVVPNADGSIAVGATVGVGVLATDAQHGLRGGGAQHALVVSGGAAGFISGFSQAKLDGLPASAVPTSRTLTAGTGMTGGGDLSVDRTFDVVANADGSIVANANDIQVGVLATDAQHGLRGGGTQHALVTALAAGFASPAMLVELSALATSTITAGAGLTGGGLIDSSPTINAVANADGSIVVNPNDIQVGVLATDAQHGLRGGGTQHALVTALLAGFMSPAMLASLTSLTTNGDILQWGNGSVTASTTTRYLTPSYDDSTAPILGSIVQFRASFAGTLKNLRIRHNQTGGNGNAIVYTVRINGVVTLLSVSLASTTIDGSNLVNTPAIAVGDLIDIEVTKALGIAGSPSGIIATLQLAA